MSSSIISFPNSDVSPPDLVQIAAQLGTPVRLKTWSVIVTFFGDAVLPRGGNISALSLGQAVEAMGIEAGAIRTAISRLASDGWIERERQGRASYYRLASYRERDFRKAGELIYAGAGQEQESGSWAIGVMPGDLVLDAEIEAHALPLQKGWYLFDISKISRDDLPSALMLFEGHFAQKPAWFLELLAPQDLAEMMERLIDVFSPVLDAMNGGWKPPPLEALAFRCLLIHEWRRIALRLHKLPMELMPMDWPEMKCRKLTGDLYSSLFAISETWLDTEAQCLNGKLPPVDAKVLNRFG